MPNATHASKTKRSTNRIRLSHTNLIATSSPLCMLTPAAKNQPTASETNAEEQAKTKRRRVGTRRKPRTILNQRKPGEARTEVELPERSAPNLLPQLELPSDHVLHPRGPRDSPHEPRRRSCPLRRSPLTLPARRRIRAPERPGWKGGSPRISQPKGGLDSFSAAPRAGGGDGAARRRPADRIRERTRRFRAGFGARARLGDSPLASLIYGGWRWWAALIFGGGRV